MRIMKTLSQSSGDLAIIIENLKKISSDPSFQTGARHSSCVLKSLDEILRQKGVRAAIAEAPASMNKTLSNMSQMNDYMSKVVESIPETSKNMETGNSLMATAISLWRKVMPWSQRVMLWWLREIKKCRLLIKKSPHHFWKTLKSWCLKQIALKAK